VRITRQFNLNLIQYLFELKKTVDGDDLVCGIAAGYGFRNLNILAATLQAYRDATRPTTPTPPANESTTVVRCGSKTDFLPYAWG
jgi:hypothetical protein